MKLCPVTFVLGLLILFSNGNVRAVRFYDDEYIAKLRNEVHEMFTHAYDSYLKYAFPYDELRPLSCDGVDTWGSYSLTLIDALDTLAVMGNYTEFRRVVNILIQNADFVTNNINVSVFETNIRIIGGLLSAHLLSYRAGISVEQGWPCNGPLLELAENVAKRLIAAFDTATGMPYGTVNLQHGVPHNETTVTCTAGVGTFILEFSTLSRLTGDPMYEELAINALFALWHHRSSIGLVGNHIDIQTGRWTAQDAGIGAGVDSYFEYLAKGALLLQKPELMYMFNEYRKTIDKYLKRDDWYMWASMTKGQLSLLVFQSLEAYWPGVLSLVGDITEAMKSIHNYHQVWKQFGFTPEFYNIRQGEAAAHRESYPLRPELIESVMYLYRATGDQFLLQVGEDILRSIQHSSYTPCGYATIKDVRDHIKDDRMESFFLAETTKYLYLLFDNDNFMHNNGQHGSVFETPWGECIIDSGGYFFNTEAHPVDAGALHCCDRHTQEQIRETILEFDPTIAKGEKLTEHRRKMKEQKAQKLKMQVSLGKPTVEPRVLDREATDEGQETEKGGEAVTVARVAGSKEVGQAERFGEERERHKMEDEDSYMGGAGEGFLVDQDHVNSTAFYTPRTTGSSETEDKTAPNGWSESDSDARIHFSAIFGSLFRSEKKRHFEPQVLIERVRREQKYSRNITWEGEYHLLRCPAQGFLSRVTLNGEFYDIHH